MEDRTVTRRGEKELRRLKRCLPPGKKHGITELHPDVVSYVSHATQQRLQNLVEKISETAQQKNFSYKVTRCRPEEAELAVNSGSVLPGSLFLHRARGAAQVSRWLRILHGAASAPCARPEEEGRPGLHEARGRGRGGGSGAPASATVACPRPRASPAPVTRAAAPFVSWRVTCTEVLPSGAGCRVGSAFLCPHVGAVQRGPAA